MDRVIIPKKFVQDDLVVITRSDYERLLGFSPAMPLAEEREVNEEDVLQWSQEARKMKQDGVLPVLASLKDLRQ